MSRRPGDSTKVEYDQELDETGGAFSEAEEAEPAQELLGLSSEGELDSPPPSRS